jgi:hypothetical protein
MGTRAGSVAMAKGRLRMLVSARSIPYLVIKVWDVGELKVKIIPYSENGDHKSDLILIGYGAGT